MFIRCNFDNQLFGDERSNGRREGKEIVLQMLLFRLTEPFNRLAVLTEQKRQLCLQ